VYKLLSNRSQLYIRIGEYEKALVDANKCIKLASDHWKAYRSKAYFDLLLIQRKCFQNEHELFVQCQYLLEVFVEKDDIHRIHSLYLFLPHLIKVAMSFHNVKEIKGA
jgi:hypothetical protein